MDGAAAEVAEAEVEAPARRRRVAAT